MQEPAPIEATEEDRLALMDEILERLKLLNYEREFLKARGLKQLNSMYFTQEINPSEQFNYFKNLVKWLMTLNDVQGSDFSKYDDPMTVSTNIINQCKKMGIACDYPPLKLRTGSGEQVLVLLHQLTAKALKKTNFVFKKPELEQGGKEEEPSKNEEQTNVEMQDQVEDVDIEEDDLDGGQYVSKQEINEDRQVINSIIPEKDWQLECQRVANKLKITAKPDNKEWRAHVDSTRTCGETIKKSIPQSRVKLQKLGDDITRTLEKITKSERVINSNMSDIGSQYRTKSEELRELSTRYNNLNAAIKEMNENHRSISEKLQVLTKKAEQHSGTMTDSSPVVKIKASIQKLVSQIKSIDVRIGVLNHTVLQYRTKQKKVDDHGDLNGLHAIDEFEDE